MKAALPMLSGIDQGLGRQPEEDRWIPMVQSTGPIRPSVSYTDEHVSTTACSPLPSSARRRTRGRHRAARPYLASLPDPETLVLPVITEEMEPPAPVNAPIGGRHRRTGPWSKHPGHTAPADDMADLASLVRQVIAQRPDVAHRGSIRTGVDPR